MRGSDTHHYPAQSSLASGRPRLAVLLLLLLATGFAALGPTFADPATGATPPLVVLADSLRLLNRQTMLARAGGDLPALESLVREELALLPMIGATMTREPLPVAGEPGRQAALELAARLLRATQTGTWIDSLATRVECLPADDADRPLLDFMLGLALTGTEEFAAAARVLARAAESTDLVAGEARLRGARVIYRLLRDTTDPAEQVARRREALALLGGVTGVGPLASEAAFLGVEVACGELDSAAGRQFCIEQARHWIERHSDHHGAPIARLLLAEALEIEGDLEGAESVCIDLLARHPRSTQAREAWTRYGRLRAARALAPTPRARFLRATALATQGARRDAIRELERLLEDPAAVDFRARARLLQGKTLRRLGQPQQALAALDSLRQLPATVRQRREADLWSGRASWSAGHIDTAAARYRALAEAGGSSPQAVLAAWELGRMLEDEGRLEVARVAYAELARRHPRHQRAVTAGWRGGLCAYRLGLLEEAATAFDQRLPAETAVDRQRRLYWRGRVLEELGRRDEALGVLDAAAAIWPREFYGWRAAIRYALLGEAEQGLPVRLAAVTTAPVSGGLVRGAAAAAPTISGLTETAERALARGRLLLELGLQDAGRRDLRYVEKEIGNDAGAALQLAAAYVNHDVYDRAVSCGWDARQRRLGEPDELEALRYLYPIAFPAQVFPAARQNGVDPLLVLALMRRESRFLPEALSSAGARGLMQLMPRTAAGVAKQLRLQPPTRSDLFRPEINVRLGTWYLASVLRDFSGRTDEALASYNAGRRKVEEWQAAIGLADPDLFVELIGYRETRNYVQKVLNDYFYYQVIYGQTVR